MSRVYRILEIHLCFPVYKTKEANFNVSFECFV